MSSRAARTVNDPVWRGMQGHAVAHYDALALRPVEALIFDRYRHAFTRQVLEIGVGAGRLTAPLQALARELHGIDLAPAMVEHCRRRFPGSHFEVADQRNLALFPDGAVDALVAGFNVLDALDHDDRKLTLREWHRVLAPGGTLVLSSHNLGYADRIPSPWRVVSRSPRKVATNLLRLPRRVRNHHRLAPFEERHAGWALLNDEAHLHALLHHYATRDHVETELAEHDFTLVECLDLDGRRVGPGDRAPATPELHYVALRAAGSSRNAAV